MIELSGEILRGSCTPVFFVGETIECDIKLSYLTSAKPLKTSAMQKLSLASSSSSSLSSCATGTTMNTNKDACDPDTTERMEKMFSMLSDTNTNIPNSISMSSIMSSPNSTSNSNLEMSKSFMSIATKSETADSKPSQEEIKRTAKANCFLLANNGEQGADMAIAWACAQIDCHCFIDESKVILPKNPIKYNVGSQSNTSGTVTVIPGGGMGAGVQSNLKTASSSTMTTSSTGSEAVSGETSDLGGAHSFQPNKDRVGISVFSSKPKILFCNLLLRPNTTEKFTFTETLPYDLAPTFRGQFAKYTYKLTIGAQLLNKTTQLLRLPFRVYSLLDFDRYMPKELPVESEAESESSINSLDLIENESVIADTDIEPEQSSEKIMSRLRKKLEHTPSPFQIKEIQKFANLEYALQILEDINSRLSSNVYNITNPDGKIVKISLSKTNFKIGDKIVAFLDFSDAEVPCVEFKVTLQSEEVIAEECRKKPNQTLSSINSHNELNEHCMYMKKTDFTLQVPVHITPTFVSDIISLRWRLHFEFSLSKTPIQKIQKSNDPAMSLTWLPPSCLTVEVLTWDLPIVIHPFDPFIASDLIHLGTQTAAAGANKLILK